MKKGTKAVIAAVLILTAAICGIMIFGSDMYETKVSYGEFIAQLDGGQIEHADIDEDAGKVTYTLKDGKKRYYTAYPDSENFKEYMLKKGVEIGISSDALIRNITNAVTLLMTAVLIVLVLSFIKPANKFKIINRESLKTTFADVAGNEEIKEELILISNMMKDEKFRKNGAKIPKGVLLQGPPGNGKTLLARAFAGETGVNLIAATSGDFSSQFIGIGSMKIRQLFKTAKRNAPCVIFIDEIDGVGSRRMSAQQAADKEMNTILTALLNEMDGFKSSDNIMVLAATNRTEDLDEALTRPGRFDRQFIINQPDKATRLELLKKYTADSSVDGDADFNGLAIKTYGYSSAQIEALCNEAVLISVADGRETVTNADFQNAILKTEIKGNIKKQSNLTEHDRSIAAYHEAGHAIIAAHYTESDISSVSIRPTTAGAGGFTMALKNNENQFDTLKNIYGELKKLYGGRAAEYVFGGESLENVTTGASQDITEASRLAASYICLSEGIDLSVYGENGVKEALDSTKELLNKVWAETVENIKEHKNEVEALAKLLIENETVTKKELEEIIK